MSGDFVRSSEIDRELGRDAESDSDLCSENSEDIFDDSDEDPTYDPNRPQRKSFLDTLESTTIRPTVTDSDSESEVSYQTSRPVIPNVNRQVLSDDSDIDSGSSDIDENTNIWSKIEEDFETENSFSYNETPGPKYCPPPNSRPIDYFGLFFNNSILKLFTKETNRYADSTISSKGQNISPSSKFKLWKPVTVNEMLAFIIVIMNMGLIKKPTIKSYWSTTSSQNTPWFRKMFARTRFELILGFFHMVNNDVLPKCTQPGYDPCQKFQPLLDHANSKSTSLYTPHQQISIDESLIGTKSHSQLMQYLPNKHHHRWGIKLWVLCDSVTKYCMSYFCYKGSKNEGNSNDVKKNGLAFCVVKKLLSCCNLFNKGYHLFCDNFFSSLNLAEFLYSSKTFFTGTIRKNRKGLPHELKQQLPIGNKIYFKKDNLVTVAYRQKKSQKTPVLLLSTNTKIQDQEIRQRRHGRETVNKKPAIILDYNKHMGGIDHFDMMLYTYLDERRSVKYWKKVAFNIFARMVLNSFVLYKENCSRANLKSMSRYQYIVSIIEEVSASWFSEQVQGLNRKDITPIEGDVNGHGDSGTIKLPGKQEKTCKVCSTKGKRKRSRRACARCGEGCHGECHYKHLCK